MRILILNWRDIKNPQSGGAEILTHEIAKRWVKKGYSVTQFSSSFPNSLREETIDGVRIIRRGHPDARTLFSSVHFSAFKYYLKYKKNFDVVVDEVHGLPFFTPWYVRKKKVVLICEVASDLWVKMFGPIFGFLGRLTEIFYLKFVYKSLPFLTISNSTREELIKEGVIKENITVMPMGISKIKLEKFNKEKYPVLIFVGRISKSKGVGNAIKVLEILAKDLKDIKLWIVGDGEINYFNYLKDLVKKKKLDNRIKFWGFVSQERKYELMQRAQILIAPSMKEGWGLTIPEAGLVGTPAVAYNVAGLRDVVKNGLSGVITKKNSPKEMASEVLRILNDKDLYLKLSNNSKKLSASYDWDKTALVALSVIKNGKN